MKGRLNNGTTLWSCKQTEILEAPGDEGIHLDPVGQSQCHVAQNAQLDEGAHAILAQERAHPGVSLARKHRA